MNKINTRLLVNIVACMAMVFLVHAAEALGGNDKYNRLLKKGQTSFDEFGYTQALEYYLAASKIEMTQDVIKKIANCYAILEDPKNAIIWYEKGIESSKLTIQEMMKYGKALQMDGQYEKALLIFEQYGDDEGWVHNQTDGLSHLSRYYLNEGAYAIKASAFNSEADDFSPTLDQGDVVFVTNRHSSGLFKPKYNRDHTNYTDLFEVTNGSELEKLPRKINSRYHEGPATFSYDGKTMFFTRNNYVHKKASNSVDGVTMLGILHAKRNSKGKWSAPEPFQHNSSEHNLAHPTISKDGKVLYFASDMPGGYGGMDLYKSEWTGSEWSKPENLGHKINTDANEIFPFIHRDSILYFSSNGHQNLGGLDVFRVNVKTGEGFRNMGSPLNSKADDFGIVLDEDTNRGFFSSNRSSKGVGDDNVYNILIYDYLVDVQLVDTVSKQQLYGSIKVQEFLPDEKDRPIIARDGVSSLSYQALAGSVFTLEGSAQGYESKAIEFRASLEDSLQQSLVATIALRPIDMKQKEETIEEEELEEATALLAQADPNETQPGSGTAALPEDTGQTSAAGLGEATESRPDYPDDAPPGSDHFVAGDLKKVKNTTTKLVVIKSPDSEQIFFTIEESLVPFGKGLLALKKELKEKSITITENTELTSVFYSFDSFQVDEKFQRELDKMVKILNENKEVKLLLSSHTDARGSYTYNDALAQYRSKEVKRFLTSNGVEHHRIVSRDYGESVSQEICDQVHCNESQHQEFRRTDLVLQFDFDEVSFQQREN